MTYQQLDTIIIGAGLAGISAAKAIESYNQGDGKDMPLAYTVLEASGHIGGRAQSQTVHVPGKKDIIINPGAQWIHRDVKMPEKPQYQNPLLALAHKYGLRTLRDTMPRDFIERGTPTKWGGNMHVIAAARKMVDRYEGKHDLSLSQLFDQRGLGDPLALRTTFGEVETGAPLNEVSTIDVQKLVACNKGDFLMEGVGEFVNRYADEVKDHIEKNKEIDLIRWKPEGDLEVHTKDGSTYKAKKCILTVSVGVLKSGAIKFEPELPESFHKTLAGMHMGNFNKIFVVFDQDFKIPTNINTHLDVRTKSGRDIFYLSHDNGQQLVTAFVGGDMARLCDSDPELMKQKTIDGLAEVWGEEVRKHVDYKNTLVTQWGIDPLVRGGYSRVAVGNHEARQELTKPIANTIFLAGEAYGTINPETGRNWATHMAGAAISGERAAKLVMSQLRENVKAPDEKKKVIGDIVTAMKDRKQQSGHSI